MAKAKREKAPASGVGRFTVTKLRLPSDNELRKRLRAKQGLQRRVAEIIAMPESKLSLILQGKQWATASDVEAIRNAADRVCGK